MAERRPRRPRRLPPVCEPLQNKHSLLVCSIFCFFSCENHSTAKASGDGVSLVPPRPPSAQGKGDLQADDLRGKRAPGSPGGLDRQLSGQLGDPGPAISCSVRPVPPAPCVAGPSWDPEGPAASCVTFDAWVHVSGTGRGREIATASTLKEASLVRVWVESRGEERSLSRGLGREAALLSLPALHPQPLLASAEGSGA